MPRSTGWFPAVLAVCLLAGTDVGAQELGTPLLADMCATCHGPEGLSPGSIPEIASLNAEVMRAFLVGFREGDIESTVMDRIARALTDAEIEILALHFEGVAE